MYLPRAILTTGLALAAAPAFPAPPPPAKAVVNVHPVEVAGPLHPELFGVNLNTGDRARIADPQTLAFVDTLQLGSVRFPNGCEADLYNWEKPQPNQVTVDEFLAFCDRIGAEPYYTLNLQGGTENREGPIPANAPLEEKIAFRHPAPNPCGYTHHYFGTLEEARRLVRKYTVERALAGRRPILHYEMGNENWGQATTDWPFDVYARTVEAYAAGIRDVLAQAQAAHPKLRDLRLHITAVGFPMNGNNQKDPNTPDYGINTAWTAALNALHAKGAIDAVQEHFYAYGGTEGGVLAWATHNLPNILEARRGAANPRLGGYRDEKLAYTTPLEITEWNVKCWGPPVAVEKGFENAGFEDGVKGWQGKGDGAAKTASDAARRGKAGLRIDSRAGGAYEVSQRYRKGDFTFALPTVWVRAEHPPAVTAFVRQTNPGPHAGQPLSVAVSPANAGLWQRLVFGAKMEEDTTEFELVVRVAGPEVAFFDEALLHSIKSFDGLRGFATDAGEQVLFAVDGLREMAAAGVRRAHLHHLFGTYGCGMINADGTPRDLCRAFQLFGRLRGDRLVRADVEAGTFRHDHTARAYATDFNGLAPAVEAVPAFSAQASRTEDTLYLLMVNRYPDREVKAEIDLGAPAATTARLRTLRVTDLDVGGATLEEGKTAAGRKFTHRVPPLSAQVLAVKADLPKTTPPKSQ